MGNDLNASLTWNESEFNQFSEQIKREKDRKKRAEEKALKKEQKNMDNIPKKIIDQMESLIQQRVQNEIQKREQSLAEAQEVGRRSRGPSFNGNDQLDDETFI